MEHWSDLLSRTLALPWFAPADVPVPFGFAGVDGERWRTLTLQAINDTHWELTAGTEDGLVGVWHIRLFADTRAAECWGTLTNRGTQTTRGLIDSLTLDMNLALPRQVGQPWLRTVNGVRWFAQSFPPYDFALVDRQLLYTPQVYAPIDLTGLHGRSSAEHLPCAILCDESQEHGLACFLEWSGSWRIRFQQTPQEAWTVPNTYLLGMQAGLTGLHLDLEPGQSIPMPRVLLTAFEGDLERGGNALRRHIRRHVMPKLDSKEVLPPTSYNHWFAFINDFSAAKLTPAVDASAAAGLEYFCVDGGWFNGGFRTGIGNWREGDVAKFPDGIAPFSAYVRSRGLRYGTWFEPEWAHHTSELYRQHPDWFWPAATGRPQRQLVNPEFRLMNFGLPDVQQWWIDRFVQAYELWGMRWVRWDYNQAPEPVWNADVPAGKLGWRQIEHITGLYRTLDSIMEACPDLFIEQCASGGHRIDLGTVRRGHSFWMNDHTTHSDLVRALQHGLNSVLPGNYANTNLCQNRHDFTDYDYLSHGIGGFGFSGKLWEMPTHAFEEFAAAVRRFKEYRPLLMGEYSRPTGQPRRATDYAEVMFTEGPQTLIVTFNPDGQTGRATLTLERESID